MPYYYVKRWPLNRLTRETKKNIDNTLRTRVDSVSMDSLLKFMAVAAVSFGRLVFDKA